MRKPKASEEVKKFLRKIAKLGGKRRAAKLSKERRIKIAAMGGRAKGKNK